MRKELSKVYEPQEVEGRIYLRSAPSTNFPKRSAKRLPSFFSNKSSTPNMHKSARK